MAKHIEKLTWHEAMEKLRQYNEARGYKTKGNATSLNAVVVMTKDSFDKPYSVKERSYKFSSDNKAFLPNQISNSIFGSCLDGTDVGVRLDWYIPEKWTVEYCYIAEETNNGSKTN